MATVITTINGTDVISTSRTTINDNFSSLNSNKIESDYLDTDTALAANSDVKIATQKAVKAYVDSGGQKNASETTKGIVEEATDAEVTAGTATGATGAKLFVTPAKLATRLGTVLDDAKTVTVSISSAQLLAIFTTPIQILAAPGAGKINVIDNALFTFTYGTVQYTGGNNLDVVEETSGTIALNPPAGLLTLLKSAAGGSVLGNGAEVTLVTNKAYFLKDTTTNLSTGDGTLKVSIKYRTVTL